MDRLAALRAFAAVAEAGSFSAAAARLTTSKSAVSKQVMALERDLGVRLLNRTTRKVGLTGAGEAYARRAERLLADLEDADQAVRRQAAAPAGRLRLAAPMTFGILHLGDFVAAFMKKYPDIVVDLNLSDRYIDLIEERVDLAIRIGALTDSSLQARVLAPSKIYICAAPAYLKAHGTPRKPKDLLAHHCLTYPQADGTTSWRLKGGAINVSGPAHSNNGDILRRLALKGLGVVRLPSFIAGPDIKRGALVSVLEEFVPQHSTINAVYPPSRHLAAPVRAFIDFLAARCAPTPSWD